MKGEANLKNHINAPDQIERDGCAHHIHTHKKRRKKNPCEAKRMRRARRVAASYSASVELATALSVVWLCTLLVMLVLEKRVAFLSWDKL